MAKVKNKRNNGLADKVQNKKRNEAQKKKLNPFEVHINREKTKVLGKKSKSDRGLPGVARAKAIQKRKETLGTEMKLLNKTNTFIDRRIGEKDGQLSNEDRIIARFAAERAKQHSRRDVYNLADDEVLTHRGQTLEQIEKFDDPRSSDDEEDDGRKKFGGLDDDFVSEGHFGGGVLSKTASDGAKSHKDLIEQLIAESKKRKFEKQKEKEQTLDLTEKLDSEWKDLQPVVLKKARLEDPEPAKDAAEKRAADYDKMMRELRFEKRGTPSDGLKSEEQKSKEEKKKLEQLEREREQRMVGEEGIEGKSTVMAGKHRSAEDLDDNFELDAEPDFMLAYDKDGNPLVPEHIFKANSVPNSKEQFQDGISDSSSDDDDGDDSDDNSEVEKSDNDLKADLNQDSSDNEESGNDSEIEEPIFESKTKVLKDKKEIEQKKSRNITLKDNKVTKAKGGVEEINGLFGNSDSVHDQSDDDDEGNNDSESEEPIVETKTKVKKDIKGITVEQNNSRNIALKVDKVTKAKGKVEEINGLFGRSEAVDEQPVDDDESDEESEGVDQSERNKIDFNNLDDLMESDESSDDDDGSGDNKTNDDDDDDKDDVNADGERISSFFEKSAEGNNLKELLKDKTPVQVDAALKKLIKSYDPSLAENNKELLSKLFAHLLQYINDLFTNLKREGDVIKSFLIFNKIAPHLYDLAHTNKVSSRKFISEVIKEKHDLFQKNTKKVPDLDTLIFFKLISLLYPTSDFIHPLTIPSCIFMAEILRLSRFRDSYSISRGLFVVALILEYTVLSKRYEPSAINFLRGILYLAANTSILNPIQVVPPFKLHRDAKILNLERDCTKMAVGKQMTAKDLILESIDDGFKIRTVFTTVGMLKEFFDNANDIEAQECIFEPHIRLLGRIEADLYPIKVASRISDTLKYMRQSLEVKTYTPLCREKIRPKALRLYEPDVQEVFTGGKNWKQSREKTELDKLKHKHKKEMKGALREIRRDKAYVASVKLRQKIRSDNIRKEKVKQIYKDASIQQGELNKLKRGK